MLCLLPFPARPCLDPPAAALVLLGGVPAPLAALPGTPWGSLEPLGVPLCTPLAGLAGARDCLPESSANEGPGSSGEALAAWRLLGRPAVLRLFLQPHAGAQELNIY